MKTRQRALVPLRGHGGLWSRHEVKMAANGHCPGYGIHAVGWIGQERWMMKARVWYYLSYPPEKARVGVEDKGENDPEHLKV